MSEAQPTFEFLPEKRNFIEFQKDRKTRKAVERKKLRKLVLKEIAILS